MTGASLGCRGRRDGSPGRPHTGGPDPAGIIRDEFRSGQAIYFTGKVEERITPALREAIYGLRDEKLSRTFEQAAPTLRELAATIGPAREEAGKRCMPQIEEMLARLGELERTYHVRPDSYIGFRSDTNGTDLDGLLRHLVRWFPGLGRGAK